jgi:Acetyltransferase (GNAT) domain
MITSNRTFRRGHVYCMQANWEIVGLIILDGPTLDLMIIDVDHQRRGLGRALLTQAEAMLFTRYEEIRLESFASNHTANAFYEACGWSAAGPLESESPARSNSCGAVESRAPPDGPPRQRTIPAQYRRPTERPENDVAAVHERSQQPQRRP